MNNNLEGSAMLAKAAHQNGKAQNYKKNQKKEDKSCDYCKEIGHVRDTCFKLHGYSNWFKQLKKDKISSNSKGYAHLASNSTDE